MSCLKLCDCIDCYQSENDSWIFHIDFETKAFLKEYCSSWFNFTVDDICKDCIDMLNEEFEDLFETNKYMNLRISKMYLDNPYLLD